MKQVTLEIKVIKFFDDEKDIPEPTDTDVKDAETALDEVIDEMFDFIGGDEVTAKFTAIDGRVYEATAVKKDELPKC